MIVKDFNDRMSKETCNGYFPLKFESSASQAENGETLFQIPLFTNKQINLTWEIKLDLTQLHSERVTTASWFPQRFCLNSGQQINAAKV